MLNVGYKYADTVEIISLDSNQKVEAEVLSFKLESSLSVSVNRQIKLILKYNKNNRQYVGRSANMTFVSNGPKKIVTAQGKRGSK